MLSNPDGKVLGQERLKNETPRKDKAPEGVNNHRMS
jgi:hypothetical protein